MGEDKLLPLRVLYTVNTSPQYVLARSQQKVPVTVIQESDAAENRASSSQVYGRTGLDFCAMALCQSSPEMMPDGTKDYSVYVLDPLEDIQSKARYGSAAANSKGVAVGMGLLSMVLNPHLPTNLQVTGTIIGCDTEDAALEVIISLRQVQAMPSFMPPMAPPHMAPMHPFAPPPPANSKRKQASRGKEDVSKPIFATNPLPSFAERISQKTDDASLSSSGPLYHMPPSQFNPHFYYPPHPGYQMPSMMPPQYFAPPRDPAKDTIAALLPTPYIGPPRRPPGRPRRSPSPSGVIEIAESPKLILSAPHTIEQSESDSASSLLPSSDASDADVSSCSTAEPQAPAEMSAAQNAAILNALSSVSSSKVDLASISAGTPSPELVNLLKLYIAAIESQGKASPDATNVPMSTKASPGTLSGKENADPSYNLTVASASFPKSTVTKPNPTPCSTTPLGIGAFNSKTQNAAPVYPPSKHEVPKQPENGRKRRLSDCVEKDNQLVNSRRVAIATSAPGRRAGCVGVSNGTSSDVGGSSRLSSTQTGAKVTASSRKSLFQTTGETSSKSRKGPYVVPEWARGVPAPSPPRRFGLEDVMDRKSKAKKAEKFRKSKSLGRLGGKNHGAQTSPARPTTEKAADMSEFERMLSESLAAPTSLAVQSNSPKASSSTVRGRMPLIAQSSPVSSATKTSAFRAFDTSPLRPMRARTSSGEALPPSTPLRAVTNPDGETEESSSPLFTPSPYVKSAHKEISQRLPGLDVPPSPSPTCRRKRSATPPVPTSHDSESEDSDCRSNSLPIASDDEFVFKRPATPSTPKPHKRFDWKSLDLPPSSPPKTSPLMEAMELPNVDVEMLLQDIPSSDSMQEAEQSSEECLPSSSTGSEMPSTPKPNSQRHERSIGTSWPTFPENIDFSDASDMLTFPDLGACPPEFQMPTSFGPVSPSTKAMFEALQNGLGAEDFSEAWKLMNDVMQPSMQSLEHDFGTFEQSWFAEAKTSDTSANVETATSSAVDAKRGEIDLASMAATAFEDLLSGCLV